MKLHSNVRGVCHITVYLLFTFACMPIQAILLKCKGNGKYAFPRWYHRACTKLIGFEVLKRGEVSEDASTLFVTNHSSYIDIIILASLLKAAFVARKDMGNWPFFGTLARLQNCVFIEREKKRSVDEQANNIQKRLQSGGSIVLFAEGTTSDGNRVLPFKSSLFAAADGTNVRIQPVSIMATALDGLPLGRMLRPLYAWYGDMTMPGHLFKTFALGRKTITVEFHPPVKASEFPNRKELAKHCHAVITKGVDRALRGGHNMTKEQINIETDSPSANKSESQDLRKKTNKLKALLSGITTDNIHKAVDTKQPQGREIW